MSTIQEECSLPQKIVMLICLKNSILREYRGSSASRENPLQVTNLPSKKNICILNEQQSLKKLLVVNCF